MGLKERRAQKDFEDNAYPGLVEEVRKAAGFDVEIEVNWPTLCVDEYAHMYSEFWTKVYFTPLIAALTSITADDMGKEALAEGLKKIRLTNESGTYYGDRCAKLEGGTLTVDHKPESNVDDVKQRTEGIQKQLEDNL